MSPIPPRALFLLIASLAAAPLRAADAPPSLPFVSPVFSSNMVLQRGKPNPIWGWARPGDRVRVSIGASTADAVAGSDGRWEARIQPPAPGGPYTVVIDGPSHVELKEVLVGDVWLCGGQSNMALGLGIARNGAADIKDASNPEIRLLVVDQHSAYSRSAVPQLAGPWQICSPETVGHGGWGGFSAVGYYFGHALQDRVHVPIGLIEDCVGGTPAETWTSPETLARMPDFAPAIAEMNRLRSLGGPEYGNYIMHWYDAYDAGAKGDTWAAPSLDDSAWKSVHLPGAFKELGVGDVPAVIWLRREITLPDPLPPGRARLYLGVVEKMDTAYINGKWVGASSWVENPRVYPIPDGVLKPGKNLITLRIFKLKADEGFLDKPETIRLEDGGAPIPLAGEWKGALSVDARPPHPLPLGYENYPTMPTVLYQGMLEPLAPLAITGAIWYQGEANSPRAHQYRTLLPAMIGDWRALFGQGNFPFYIAQLPAVEKRKSEPGSDDWSELREAQAMTARTVPNTGLAVTIDTGEANDIHPKEKKPVGERLALLALAGTYGQHVVSAGPSLSGFAAEGGSIRLHMTGTDGGLVSRGKPAEFSVAGADRVWHWADARIEGDDIIVSSPKVPNPVAARYAWQANPEATVFNGAGLPAVPFRTDDWPGVTDNAR